MTCGLYHIEIGHISHLCCWCKYELHSFENDKYCREQCEHKDKCGFVIK